MTELACPGRPRLPVGKIVAVGRNYAEHVREMREMSGSVGVGARAEPVLFLKPPSALVPGEGPDGRCEVALPSFSRLVHHEVELVVRVGRGGRRFNPAEARAAIDALAVGLDLTARDLQNQAKERGDPWAIAKGFDGSAPISPLVPVDAEPQGAAGGPGRLGRLELELSVNGALRQRGSTADLLLPVAELVAFVSSRFRLEPGDLVFTGTPAGVGPLVAGDVAIATVKDAGSAMPLARLEVRCVPPG